MSPTSPDVSTPRRFMLRLAVGVRTPIALGVAYGILTMLARSFVPIVTGIAIDQGILKRDQHALLVWGAVMFGLVVFQAVTTTLQERCDFATNIGTSYRVMQLVGTRSAELGATLRKRVSTGEVVNLGIGDITPIGQALAATSRGLGGVAAIVGVAVIMLISAWQLALTVLIGVPALVWLLTRILTPVRRKQRAVRQRQGELAAVAVDIAGGLRVLRGIGGEEHYAQRFRDKSQSVRHASVEAAGLQARAAAARTILNGLFSTAVVWLGAHLVLSGELQVGQLVAFYGYAVFLATPLRWMTDSIEYLAQGQVSAERVSRFLALERDLPDGPAGRPAQERAELADPESGLVFPFGSFMGVACTLPDDVATLADRLGRYTESEVTLAAVPAAELSLANVRERVLVVGNDDYLFAGTLGDGLDPTGRAGTQGVMRAAEIASALDIIEALPGGLGGESQAAGRNFSGGERQRLRLLRALVADPDILVLLEPTSALDALTETSVAGRLRESRAGKTTVVFTTSPAVLGLADGVWYVEDGKAVASGAHSALLADERYKALVTREADTA